MKNKFVNVIFILIIMFSLASCMRGFGKRTYNNPDNQQISDQPESNPKKPNQQKMIKFSKREEKKVIPQEIQKEVKEIKQAPKIKGGYPNPDKVEIHLPPQPKVNFDPNTRRGSDSSSRSSVSTIEIEGLEKNHSNFG